MHLAVAAAPRHGFERRHRVAVVVQRFAHRDLAKLRQDGGCIGPGVGGRFRVHRPAIDQGQWRRWMQFCDHNVLRQCGAQRSSGPHFARRYRVDAFGDPPHDVIERHQTRDPLATLQGGNHAGYVAGTGGRGQEGAADMIGAPVWIDETTPRDHERDWRQYRGNHYRPAGPAGAAYPQAPSRLQVGATLVAECTDPLAEIDIRNLMGEPAKSSKSTAAGPKPSRRSIASRHPEH